MQETEKTEAIAFVVKKVLLTLNPPICLLMSGTPVFAGAVIAEYEQAGDDKRMRMPEEFKVVGTPDGRKLPKAYRVRMSGWHSVIAMVELENEDWR